MKASEILTQLKNSGERITAVRTQLVELFTQHQAYSAKQILEIIQKDGKGVNKTTVYRELYFLLEKGIIKEINIGNNIQMYEIDEEYSHHHHLICTDCKKIEHITIDDENIDQQAARISKEKKFKMQYHSLEFFGLCNKCSQ